MPFSGSNVFTCDSHKGVQLAIFGVGLDHLSEHKFKYSFQDSINPVCSCGKNIETVAHFLLHYPEWYNEWSH